MKTWKKEEVDWLMENYNLLTNQELCEKLQKSFLSIYKKARSLGLYKTKEMEFKNRSIARKGEKGSNWKGGKHKTKKGYVLVLKKDHPFSSKKGYIMEHRLIMEIHLKRYLNKEEDVHHINGKKDDNRIENLKLVFHSEHTRNHNLGKNLSLESRKKISQKAKERFKNKENHPLYKKIDTKKIIELRKKGLKVKEICKELKISGRTYYNKMEEHNE